MADDDRLRELARRGKAATESREAAERAADRRLEEARQAQRRDVAAASTTALGWLDTGEASFLAPLLLLGVGTLLVGMENPAVLRGSLAAHIALLGLLVLVRILRIRGGAREEAWVASLPFPLEGYLSALGDREGRTSSLHTSGKSIDLDITVRFAAEVPPDAEAIFAGFDSKLAARNRIGGELHLRRQGFPGGETNYPLHRFVRKLVPEVLVPLHQRTPLTGVRFAFRK
jgi:hypothetical protein